MMNLKNYKGSLMIGICTCLMGTASATTPEIPTQTTTNDYLPYHEEKASEYPVEMYQVILDPLYRTLLSAQIQSPVEKIYKRMGDSFNKGDILIQLDDTVYKSNLNEAEKSLNKAQVELDGKEQLFHDNVASLFELKDAEAKLAKAKAELSIAKRDLNATTIKAPYDGKVVSVNIEEHELPQAGKDLMEVVYDKILLAKMLLPASMLKDIHLGQPFTIYINELNKRITAKILRIGAVIDPSSSTIKIEAEINNRDELIKPGMTGKADFDNTEKTLTESTTKPNNEIKPNINSKK